MFKKIIEFFKNGTINIYNNTKRQVKIINDEYRVPHTSSKPIVRISLIVLRLYLIGLIAIIVYKFVLVVATGKVE